MQRDSRRKLGLKQNNRWLLGLCLARVAMDLRPGIAAVDVNPVIVGESGCVAVDALVVPVSRATA